MRWMSFVSLACLLAVPTNWLRPVFAAEPVPLRDLNSHCPFHPLESLEAWQKRAADLRLQLQVSLGMWPALELDPVDPNIYGRIQRNGYTIEKLTFESLPGFWVTGNLYRPEKVPEGAKLPGVLCPHGHWQDARFYEAGPDEVRRLLAQGAERFETAARNHIQARCVQLARMGCVVFHWDMIGYCDSTQISYERAHRFAQQPRDTEVTEQGWLLFSPRAEAHCQSVLGLQSLATQRAVDMLLGLPDVDAERIAITGASGGGTQSFIGAALDPRIRVAFPAVMVSTGMQGGCTCENACLLRTGTGNVEMAGLIAPRPLGLTAADDWTKTMPEDGYPELRTLYRLFDAEDKVALFPALHFGHNFNHVSRTSMYGWMNQHLELGFTTPVLERDFGLAEREELTCWDEDHPRPPGGEDFERRLMKLWAELVEGQLSGLRQGDRQQMEQLASILGQGWRVCLGATSSPTSSIEVTATGQESPELIFQSAEGTRWTLQSGQPVPANPPDRVRITVADGSDTFTFAFQGGNADDQPLVDNPRLAAAYTFGYNLPVFVQHARRLGQTVAWLSREYPQQPVTVHGVGQAAALAAAGVFLAEEQTGAGDSDEFNCRLILTPKGFAFEDVDSIRASTFLPGAARFWDLPGLVATLRSPVTVNTDQPERFEKLRRLVELRGGVLELP